MRGATLAERVYSGFVDISIHAPRAGGDYPYVYNMRSEIDFNPRPPCGGRRTKALILFKHMEFQSTPPVRGATAAGDTTIADNDISIHAPRAGGD